jgi:RNA polymerase sigma-70 factor (ECF subfamily)
VAAAVTGEVGELTRLLAEDAELYADGGGKRRTALNPIVGKDRILRYYDGIRAKGLGAFTAQHAESATLNGLPGFVFQTAEGTETLAFGVAHGAITALYWVCNPDKVRHLS